MTITYENLYTTFGETKVNNLASDPKYDIITAGYLKTGQRYVILNVSGSASFTSVGAASNTVGVVFRATTSAVLPTWGTGSLQKGYSNIENITTKINEATDALTSYANKAGQTVDLTQEYQINFVIYYAMYLLYLANDYEESGIQERKEALQYLERYWGGTVYDGENLEQQNTKPMLKPYASVASTWTGTSLADFLEEDE
jgi:hypothetical protein